MPIAEARLPILDLGFLRSDATYDVVAVWNGRFFRLDEHLDRFFRGPREAALGHPGRPRRPHARSWPSACAVQGIEEGAYVEAIATRGMPQPGSRDIRLCVNQLYCFAIPYVWLPTPEQRERGLRLVDRRHRAHLEPRGRPAHQELPLARLRAGPALGLRQPAATTSCCPTGKGLVTEGAGFNIFVVQDGVLRTPATNVLEGITRMTVLDIARELGLPVDVGEVTVGPAARRGRGVRGEHGGRRLLRHVGRWRDPGRRPHGPGHAAVHDTYWAWHDDPRFTLAVAEVAPVA